MNDFDPNHYRQELSAAADEAAGWLRHLIDPDQVVELRALDVRDGKGAAGRPSTWAGTFRGDELTELATEAMNLSGNCSGVYYTLNPLRPDRLAERFPRVRRVARPKRECAGDEHVLARRWVLIDVDPVRPAGQSATAAEKAAAWAVLGRARAFMAENSGLSTPTAVTDSGNGYHLLYRLKDAGFTLPLGGDDLPRQFLRRLAAKFDTPAATIDTKVFNPARIVKLPGTLAMKGEPTADRPHRRANVLEVNA